MPHLVGTTTNTTNNAAAKKRKTKPSQTKTETETETETETKTDLDGARGEVVLAHYLEGGLTENRLDLAFQRAHTSLCVCTHQQKHTNENGVCVGGAEQSKLPATGTDTCTHANARTDTHTHTHAHAHAHARTHARTRARTHARTHERMAHHHP